MKTIDVTALELVTGAEQKAYRFTYDHPSAAGCFARAARVAKRYRLTMTNTDVPDIKNLVDRSSGESGGSAYVDHGCHIFVK